MLGSRGVLGVVALTVATLLAAAGGASAATDDLRLVSRAGGADGAKSNAGSFTPSISANGRFVTFASNASNLSADDTDGATDIFVRDLQAGTLALVSRASGAAGAKGTSGSAAPRISADGARIAFSSHAPNLDPDDPDADPD